MAQCPECRRPVAMVRSTCVYCGAALPTEAVAEAARTAEAAAAPAAGPAPNRVVLVVDLSSGTPQEVSAALGLSLFEANQRLRRGGLQFHRIVEEEMAPGAAAALRQAGLSVVAVTEEEARIPPVVTLGGRREEGVLALRTEAGALRLRTEDLLLIVRGPITREYQPSLDIRRVQTASLGGGYRIHLHRRADPRPLELDPGNFEMGFAVAGSALLELTGWLDSLAPPVEMDEAFGRIPPVLGHAVPTASGVLAATAGLHRAARKSGFGKDEGPVILDNVAQFRFYSGWRGAVARRAHGG
jgi:hypothetical protein